MYTHVVAYFPWQRKQGQSFFPRAHTQTVARSKQQCFATLRYMCIKLCSNGKMCLQQPAFILTAHQAVSVDQDSPRGLTQYPAGGIGWALAGHCCMGQGAQEAARASTHYLSTHSRSSNRFLPPSMGQQGQLLGLLLLLGSIVYLHT